MEIICFFVGIAFLYLKTAYALIFMLIVLFLKTTWRFFLFFSAGIGWAFIHQWWVLHPTAALPPVVSYAQVDGYIASIPNHSNQKVQFQFLTSRLNGRAMKANLLLSCFEPCPELNAGEYWHFNTKLKKPKNFANLGGFDYEKGLKARHIDHVGYLRKTGHIRLVQKKGDPLLVLRARLAQMLEHIDSDENAIGIVQALTLGVTTHMNKAQWDLFRRTGTTHLMVISGSHITLVAGVVYFLVKWFWCRLSTMNLRCPAPKIASLCALFAALIYALLAGFEVPVQRALIVCFFMFLRFFCHQRFGAWQAWRYALFTVLCFEPHSVLLPGFYLSFLAVAILVSIGQRLTWRYLCKIIGVQMACAFGLMPLTLYWFSYGSINGLVANLLAIPWVSFVITPMAIWLLCFGQWWPIPGFVFLLNKAIEWLMIYLTWIDSFAHFNIEWSFSNFFTPLMLMIMMCLAIFMPIKRLWWMVGLLFIHGSMPKEDALALGDFRMRVLDVGQGLSVVIHTARHTLVYDTGLAYRQGIDMGKMVIIPYLHAMHIKVLDAVVISHPDLDHRGGLPALEENYLIRRLLVNDPSFYHKGVSCHRASDWQWDGVNFHFFPIITKHKRKNNTSCILQIKTKAGSVLLTGDIEKQAEYDLAKQYGTKLHALVMVVPHHGSKTSSSSLFVDQVAPKYAIASYGFANAYHFPHKQAMNVYHSRRIKMLNTVDCGMVTVDIKTGNSSPALSCYHPNWSY